MISVLVCGACGRMGRLIISEISKQGDMKLVGAVDAPNHPDIGKDAGEIAGTGKLGVNVLGADCLGDLLRSSKPDVLVDFTSAPAAVENVQKAAEAGVSVVVGTTGFTEEQREHMEDIIKRMKIRAVISPNMSVGVNVFFSIIKQAARMLGGGYGAEIVEVHHIHKKDAPSGTAKRAAQILADIMSMTPNEIKIKSIREDEIVGDHTVILSNPNEVLEITHRAKRRETFAAGVIRAIRHVVEKGKPGEIHDMQNVLGLR